MKKFFSTFLSLVIFSFLTIPNFFAGNHSRRRQKFTPEEDKRLIELVNEHGESNWVLIASLMENRTVRQCRERWKHYLSVSGTGNKPFSPEEDEVILKKVEELGHKWTKIAAFLPGRSDLNIKNRWFNFIRRHCNSIGLRHAPIRRCNILPEQNPEQVHVASTLQLEFNQEGVVPEPLEPNQESGLNSFETPPFFEDDNIFGLEDDFDRDKWDFYPF